MKVLLGEATFISLPVFIVYLFIVKASNKDTKNVLD